MCFLSSSPNKNMKFAPQLVDTWLGLSKYFPPLHFLLETREVLYFINFFFYQTLLHKLTALAFVCNDLVSFHVQRHVTYACYWDLKDFIIATFY